MATVYVSLVDEETEVWRPVDAVELGAGQFVLSSAPQKDHDERWAFPPGAHVRCEYRTLSGDRVLVAVEQITPAG